MKARSCIRTEIGFKRGSDYTSLRIVLDSERKDAQKPRTETQAPVTCHGMPLMILSWIHSFHDLAVFNLIGVLAIIVSYKSSDEPDNWRSGTLGVS